MRTADVAAGVWRRLKPTCVGVAPRAAKLRSPSSAGSPSLQPHAAVRWYSSSPDIAAIPEWSSPEARFAAQGLLDRWGVHGKMPLTNGPSQSATSPATTLQQTLDSNQLLLLRVTLGEMIPLQDELLDARASSKCQSSMPPARQTISFDPPPIPEGTPLLPGEHLVYFTPRTPLSTLGNDGSDTIFNPPGGVFVRRMWAGGSMEWNSQSAGDGLRVGQEVRERTWIESAEVKRLGGGKGGEMILVWVRKEYSTPSGHIPLVDRRSWIFQRRLPAPGTSALVKDVESADEPPVFSSQSTPSVTTLVQNSASLFRFSALTYNAHAIHLSPPWARMREGHHDIVVHGPMNLCLLLRQWYATHGRSRRLVRVDYRAKRPLYTGEAHDIVLRDLHDDSHEVQILKGAARETVVMLATLKSVPT